MRQQLHNERYRGVLDKAMDDRWHGKRFHERKLTAVAADEGVHEAAVEALTPEPGTNARLRERPLDRSILEEIYREQHGRRVERQLRKGVRFERFVCRGDGTAPVFQASGRARETFGLGHSIRLAVAAKSAQDFPVTSLPEVAFIGRTNVGKSSLINAIVNGFVCPYGHLPGTTASVDFYDVAGRMMLVDCPGYGYYDTLQVSASHANAARALLKAYVGSVCAKQRNVRRVVLVVPAMMGLSDDDLAECAELDRSGIGFMVALAATDRVPVRRLARIADVTRCRLAAFRNCHELVMTSSLRLAGIARLQNLLAQVSRPASVVDAPISAEDFNTII